MAGEKVETSRKIVFLCLDQLNEEGRLERTEDKSVYKVLDERGNFICYADTKTGMAFVYDDHERIMAYIADETREKRSWFILSRSIRMRMGRLFIRKTFCR